MPSDHFAAVGSDPYLPDTEAFPFRVLVALPKARSIPTFAMGFERGLAAEEEAVTSGFDIDGVPIDRNIVSALERGRYGPHQLVGTRTRTHPQTVVYATWAVFTAMADAEAFQRDHPKLGLATFIQRTNGILHRVVETKGDRWAEVGSDLRWRLRAFEQLRQAVTDKASPPHKIGHAT